MVREAGKAGAIGVYQVNLGLSVASRDKCYTAAIGRPAWTDICGGMMRQASEFGTIYIDYIDVVTVTIRVERDLGPVRRPGCHYIYSGMVGKTF